MNIHVNDSSPCPKVYIWDDEKKFEYQASLRNKQTLCLKKCYVPQLKGVIVIIYVIFSMVC